MSVTGNDKDGRRQFEREGREKGREKDWQRLVV